MSKSLTHVLIPFTTQVACGAPSHFRTAMYREQINCIPCRRSEWFKKLKATPRKYRAKP